MGGAVSRLRSLLKSGSISSATLTESVTPAAIEIDETYELSSVQRGNSVSSDDLKIQEWPFVRFLVSGSPFSGAMSDRVTTEQQLKEEQADMTPERVHSPISEELFRTEQWLQEMRAGEPPHLAPMYSGPISM